MEVKLPPNTDRATVEPLPQERRRRLLAAVLLGLLLLAFASASFLAGRMLSVVEIELWLQSWGSAAAILSACLMLAHAVLPFPAELLAVANGMLFGFAPGLALTWASAMVSALASFALARIFGWPLVRRLLSPASERRLGEWVDEIDTPALLSVRLIPLIPFNLVNYAAGLTGVRPVTFTWTTAVGILPVTVASTLVGSHMLEPGPVLWLAAAGLVVLIFLGHRWRRG